MERCLHDVSVRQCSGAFSRVDGTGGHNHQAVDGKRADVSNDGVLAVVRE
jgi:hypothetical protein